MPNRPLTTCPHPGCSTLTKGGRCPRHAAQAEREDVARRGGSAARGYDAEWKALRAQYARAHPLCQDCLNDGRSVPVAIVDHVIPHRGNDALRLAWSNLRSLCRHHHGLKTASEGAGYKAAGR